MYRIPTLRNVLGNVNFRHFLFYNTNVVDETLINVKSSKKNALSNQFISIQNKFI